MTKLPKKLGEQKAQDDESNLIYEVMSAVDQLITYLEEREVPNIDVLQRQSEHKTTQSEHEWCPHCPRTPGSLVNMKSYCPDHIETKTLTLPKPEWWNKNGAFTGIKVEGYQEALDDIYKHHGIKIELE